MMNTRLMLLLGAACSCLIAGCGPPEWKLFTSEEGSFQVEMRGSVRQTTEHVEKDNEPLEVFVFTAETHLGKADYIVSYCDYSESTEIGNPYQALTGIEHRLSAGMEIFDQSIIPVEGGICRESLIRGEMNGDPTVIYARLYLYDRRLYQVIYLASMKVADRSDARHFLDSFQATL